MDAFFFSMKLPVVLYIQKRKKKRISQPNKTHVKEKEETNLGVVLENLVHLRHPAHVQRVRQSLPAGSTGRSNEASVFGRETKQGDMTPVLFQEIAVPTGDQVDNVPWVLGKRSDYAQRLFRRGRVGGNLDYRGERSLSAVH